MHVVTLFTGRCFTTALLKLANEVFAPKTMLPLGVRRMPLKNPWKAAGET